MFYDVLRAWGAEKLVFYDVLRAWDAEKLVFYDVLRAWDAEKPVFYEVLRALAGRPRAEATRPGEGNGLVSGLPQYLPIPDYRTSGT